MMSEMKKVGILTFHYVDNCGAMLQLLALKSFIEQIGYNVEIINYKSHTLCRRNSLFRSPFCRIKEIKSEDISKISKIYKSLRSIGNVLKSNLYIAKRLKIKKRFKEFRNEFFSGAISNPIERIEQLNFEKEYYAIVVGSDQVWNTELFAGEVDSFYFLQNRNLSCVNIAYAGSAGGDINEVELNLESLFCNFNYLSAREKLLAEKIAAITQRQVETVLDPVFLHDVSFWKKYIGSNIWGEYILLYPLEGNKELYKMIDILRKEYGIKVCELGYRKLYKDSHLISDYSPITFLNLIYHAKIIVTNSFHATAFSVILKKEIWVLKHSKRNMRIENLLEQVDISNRMIAVAEDLKKAEKKEMPDTTMILQKEIATSKNFLYKALKEKYE